MNGVRKSRYIDRDSWDNMCTLVTYHEFLFGSTPKKSKACEIQLRRKINFQGVEETLSEIVESYLQFIKSRTELASQHPELLHQEKARPV